MSELLQTLYLRAEELPKSPVGWRPGKVDDIAETLKPGKLFDEKSVSSTGEVPVVNQSKEDFHGFHSEEPGVIASDERPVATFANHTCAMRLMRRPFSCIQNIFPRVGKSGVCDTVFFYYATLGRVRLSGYKGHHPIYRDTWIPLPPIDTQTRIATILSTYDDAIENNRRRMCLLEKAARLLYEEWFVRLRFPGHEHTPVKNGLPQGWERVRIGDLADCIGGGTPSTKIPNYWDDGDIEWITPTDVTRNDHFVLIDTQKKITEAGLENSSAKIVPPHAVLMTSRASVGFFAIAGREVCTNQGFISIVPHDLQMSHLLLFQLSHRVEEIRGMGSGSTFPEVSRGKFREFEILLPAQRLVTDYQEQATAFLSQIRILKLQNQKLRTARDLLLPRLMSGEIEV